MIQVCRRLQADLRKRSQADLPHTRAILGDSSIQRLSNVLQKTTCSHRLEIQCILFHHIYVRSKKHTHPVTGQRTSSTCSVPGAHVQKLFVNTEVGHLNRPKWLRMIVTFAPLLFVRLTPYKGVRIFKRNILYELQYGKQIFHSLW